MRRGPGILPDGIAGRFALLLSAALIAANLIAFVVLALDRMGSDARAGATREVERIVALVPAMEAVAPQVRVRIARDASTRFARVAVESAARVTATAPDARSREIAERVSEALAEASVPWLAVVQLRLAVE